MAQTNDGITLPLRIFQWSMCSLVNAIIKLPEPDFLYLVSRRLYDSERFLSLNSSWHDDEKIPDGDKREFYAGNFLAEDIFLKLSSTKILVKRNENDIPDDNIANNNKVTVYKYYSQALRLYQVIAVSRPRPKFIVNASDLDTRII
jgi:hypothetical protein